MVQLKGTDGPGTRCVHAGVTADPQTGAVTPPLHLSSTFVQEAVGVHKGFEYARTGNPTRGFLEKAIAELEAGPDGAAAGARGLAFASGSAALDTLLRLLDTGDHVVCAEDAYGGTIRLLTKVTSRWGLRVTFVDTRDLDAVRAAMTPKTRMVLMETPTNPMLRVSDIQAVADITHAAGALLVVDNTFMSPALQRPLQLGADLVYHSATKYIGGHSDVVGGLIVAKDPKIADDLAFLQNSMGAILGPFDSFLLLRGLKTLQLRMERHCASAAVLAQRLQDHPAVQQVYYPGLSGHPNADIQARQASGAGGMVSFRVADGATARSVVAATRLFQLAESLGAVESLIQVPAAMTHAAVPLEIRQRTKLDAGLIRLSVGVEDVEDLWQDLQQALTAAPEKAVVGN